jgi:hypothetical protein
MAEPYPNLHGRKGSRGIRPWLLIPKVLAVGAYFGGLLAAIALWLIACSLARDTANLRDVVVILHLVGWLFEFLIVPSLLASILLGVLLFVQHPGPFARLRWWQAKMVTLVLGVPLAHLYLSSRLPVLREETAAADEWNAALATRITWVLAATLLVSVWVIVLGRLKPRLGQNWALSYPLPKPPAAQERKG